MKLVSPTGPMPVVRVSDPHGDGRFGAPRGTLASGEKKHHDGLDLIVTPGQPIYCPMDGYFDKVDYPYGDDLSYHGFQMSNSKLRVEIWYMEPNHDLKVRGFLEAGTVIGKAQDISQKYGPAMTPHVHVRVTMLPFTVLNRNRFISYEIHVDPQLLIEGV